MDPIPSITLAIGVRLRQLGLATSRAHTLEAARALLARQRFDAVVLDLWTWPEALAMCDSLLADPDAGPIIVTTAYRGAPSIKFFRALHAHGLHEHFEKPFAIDALAGRIRELVGRRRGF